MAWVNLTFGANQGLSAAKLNQLVSNFYALAEGAEGAPRIQKSNITTWLNGSGTQTIAPQATWTPPAGVYNFVGLLDIFTLRDQLLVNGVWRTGGAFFRAGFVPCDGTTFRLWNAGQVTSIDVAWQKYV